MINKIIIEEKLNYAVPVYSIDYIKNSESNEYIQFVVDDNDFLELLYLRIRGESIKFASIKKNKQIHRKKTLKKDIESLESNPLPNQQLLDNKKQELEKLRDYKIKGHLVRSRLKWLDEGEKPTNFFCNLEKQNFTEKTIKKLRLKMY